MLVDFFIVGTQKGGTSALDYYLRSCPNVQMASVKELHFFDDEELDWSNPDYSRLHQSFTWGNSDNTIRGEATPIYTYWPNALHRLRHYNPYAKLIMGLRHPSFRARSHWRMEVKRGADTLTFTDAIRSQGRRRVAEERNRAHRIFSYVERSFYASQIGEMLSLFPRDHLFFFRTDLLWKTPNVVLDEISDFLGIASINQPKKQYVVPLLTWEPTGMSIEDRQYLDQLFFDEIKQTAKLSGLDLCDWLDPDYDEPMKPD